MPSFESKIPKPVNDVTQSPFANKKPEPLLPDIMEEEKLSAANDKDAEQQQFSNEPGAEQKPEQHTLAGENAEIDPVEKRKLQLEEWAKEDEATNPTVQRILQLQAWAKEDEATNPTVQRMLQLQAWAKEKEATDPTILRMLQLQAWAKEDEATNPTLLRKLELQKRFSLSVSQPDEPRELEADQKSEEVTSPRTVEASSDLLSGFDIGTSCPAPLLREEGSEASSEETLAAKGSSGGEVAVDRETKDYINNLPAGQSLPLKIKNFFQTRFGRSFNKVKIHNDRQANEVATAINAKAFTKGNDIVFGEGEYQPDTADGKKLIAHELTHVAQQGSIVQRMTGFDMVPPDQQKDYRILTPIDASKDEILKMLHVTLDLAGLIPALGIIFDSTNVILYVAEDDWKNAGFSAAAMIPIFGQGATVTKYGLKVSKKVIEKIGKTKLAKGFKKLAEKFRPTQGAKTGIKIEGLSYELKHLNKHLMGTKESIKLVNKEGSAHVFTDIATLSKVENTILQKGNYLGNVRGWERYGYKFDNPIGYRIGADGSKVPLYYGEMKLKNGLYHIIPRTGASK